MAKGLGKRARGTQNRETYGEASISDGNVADDDDIPRQSVEAFV